MWSMTKKPSHAFRLQTMSVHDLSNGMVAVRLRLNEAEVKHRRRKLKDGPLLNAVVAWFLSRPIAEQDAIAVDGLRRYEAVLEGDPVALKTSFNPPVAPSSVPMHDPGPVGGDGIALAAVVVEGADMHGQGDHKPPERRRAPKKRP